MSKSKSTTDFANMKGTVFFLCYYVLLVLCTEWLGKCLLTLKIFLHFFQTFLILLTADSCNQWNFKANLVCFLLLKLILKLTVS